MASIVPMSKIVFRIQDTAVAEPKTSSSSSGMSVVADTVITSSIEEIDQREHDDLSPRLGLDLTLLDDGAGADE
eukprot:8540204-Pyramimonas_sp.AAC.1